MSNPLQIEYTVESYNTDPEGRAQQSELRKVFASSPQAAALKVLQEDLHTIGDISRLRARVSHVGETGEEMVTTLYSQR
jgi:hypothetical protein